MESGKEGWRNLKKLHVYYVSCAFLSQVGSVKFYLNLPQVFISHKRYRNELYLLLTEEQQLHCFGILKSQPQALEYQQKIHGN